MTMTATRYTLRGSDRRGGSFMMFSDTIGIQSRLATAWRRREACEVVDEIGEVVAKIWQDIDGAHGPRNHWTWISISELSIEELV